MTASAARRIPQGPPLAPRHRESRRWQRSRPASSRSILLFRPPASPPVAGEPTSAPATVTVAEADLKREPSRGIGDRRPGRSRARASRSGATTGRWIEVHTKEASGFLPVRRARARLRSPGRGERRAGTILAFPPVSGVVVEDTDLLLAPFPMAPRAGRLREGHDGSDLRASTTPSTPARAGRRRSPSSTRPRWTSFRPIRAAPRSWPAQEKALEGPRGHRGRRAPSGSAGRRGAARRDPGGSRERPHRRRAATGCGSGGRDPLEPADASLQGRPGLSRDGAARRRRRHGRPRRLRSAPTGASRRWTSCGACRSASRRRPPTPSAAGSTGRRAGSDGPDRLAQGGPHRVSPAVAEPASGRAVYNFSGQHAPGPLRGGRPAAGLQPLERRRRRSVGRPTTTSS